MTEEEITAIVEETVKRVGTNPLQYLSFEEARKEAGMSKQVFAELVKRMPKIRLKEKGKIRIQRAKLHKYLESLERINEPTRLDERALKAFERMRAKRSTR